MELIKKNQRAAFMSAFERYFKQIGDLYFNEHDGLWVKGSGQDLVGLLMDTAAMAAFLSSTGQLETFARHYSLMEEKMQCPPSNIRGMFQALEEKLKWINQRNLEASMPQ